MASLRTHNHRAARRRAYRFSSARVHLRALFAHDARIAAFRGIAATDPSAARLMDQLVGLERYRAVETFSDFTNAFLAEIAGNLSLSYEDLTSHPTR